MGAIEARWGSLRAVVLRLAIAAPATATAQPAAPAEAGVELTVQSPAGCPDTAAIDSMLERLLGPSKATGEKTRASITIEPVAPAGAEQGATETAELELTLVTETRSGRESRKLRSASCQTLAETAALFVAIVHDPDVDTSRVALSAPPREPTPAPPPLAPPPRLVAPERPRLPPRKPSIFGFALSAWGGMAGLDLPSLHGVFGGSLGLRLESFRLEAGGAFSAGSTVLPSDASKGADFTLPFGALDVCRDLFPFFDAPWPVPSLESRFGACVGLEAGAISAEGFGVSTPKAGTAPWVAPRLGLRAGLGLVGPLSIWARGTLAVPVDPRRFVFSTSDSSEDTIVHESGPVALRLELGPELAF